MLLRKSLRDPWLAAALLMALALLITNVCRAATQSFTIDEALTFHRFITPPLSEAWRAYDANHHVLLALLCRVCLRVFGPSELSMRLPVLLGGALYLIALMAMVRKLTTSGLLFFAAYACLTLNPFILDFLSVSRGYGLALGLFTAGLWFLLQEAPRRFVPAALCFGLCVAASLVFAIPAAAAIAACGFDAILQRRSLWPVILRLALPSALVAFVILIVPLLPLQRASLTYGSNTIPDMVDSLVRQSFRHHPWFAYMTMERLGPFMRIAIVGASLIPLVLAFFAAKWPPASRLVLFTFSLTLLLLVLFHLVSGLRYPYGRTGIYLPLLFVLALTASAGVLPSRWIAGAVVCMFSLATICFACEWNTRVYGEWAFDAGTKKSLKMMADISYPHTVSLASSWYFAETLNYYRLTRHLKWLEPVDREGPRRGGNYYLLGPEDAALVGQLNLRVLHKDPVSLQILAVPQSQR